MQEYQMLPANRSLALLGQRRILRVGKETPLWTAGKSQQCRKYIICSHTDTEAEALQGTEHQPSGWLLEIEFW